MNKHTTKDCAICGRPFRVPPSKYDEQRTCSKACGYQYRTVGPHYTLEKRTEMFWSRVDKSGGPDACWEWQAGRNKAGYGWTRWGRDLMIASRLAWTLVIGDPGSLFVLHKCDNPPCCNPKHLFIGSGKDNADDRDKKGRRIAPHGESNPAHKLTAADVTDIRKARAKGFRVNALAAQYGVSTTTIKAIVNRKTWKHV